MNINLEIKELLEKENCYFCQKKVLEVDLAGFEHDKDQVSISCTNSPICKSCWKKETSLIKWDDDENFSTVDTIKEAEREWKNWIKENERKRMSKFKDKGITYEEWRKKFKLIKKND